MTAPQPRAEYVQAQQSAFPYGTRLVSGPFHERGQVWAEKTRIEPYYPDCTLSAITHRAKALPLRLPRSCVPGDEPDVPTFKLSTAAGRLAAAEEIARRARDLGAVVDIENWDGEPDVDIRLPSLHATIWLGYTAAAPMPIISWYGARWPLRGVLGAWRDEDVNAAHGRKATSAPSDWPSLFEALLSGICASLDGGAFDLPAE